jgi:hypothetical protein
MINQKTDKVKKGKHNIIIITWLSVGFEPMCSCSDVDLPTEPLRQDGTHLIRIKIFNSCLHSQSRIMQLIMDFPKYRLDQYIIPAQVRSTIDTFSICIKR